MLVWIIVLVFDDKYPNIVGKHRFDVVKMAATVISADESCHAAEHLPNIRTTKDTRGALKKSRKFMLSIVCLGHDIGCRGINIQY
jgi:hypothetical protein